LPEMGVNCACGNGNDSLDVMLLAARAVFARLVNRQSRARGHVDVV
jgi:hypothetical protein